MRRLFCIPRPCHARLRHLALGLMLGCGAAGAAQAHVIVTGVKPQIAAQARTEGAPAEADPWAGREIKRTEKLYLQTLAGRLDRSLAELPIRTEMLDDHLRLRIPSAMLFVPGKSVLSPDGTAVMTLIAEKFLLQKRLRMEIVAHEDPGADSYIAAQRSTRKAVAVTSAFESRGVGTIRLKPTGLGGLFPLPDVEAEANARIELIIRPF